MYNLTISYATGVVIGLDNAFVLPKKFKVDLILAFVAFQEGQVETAVEATRVPRWAFDLRTENACVESCESSPSGTASMIESDRDFTFFVPVLAFLGSIIDSYFSNILSLKEARGEMRRSRGIHWSVRKGVA